MIAEGLLQHPRVDRVLFSQPISSLGAVLAPQATLDELKQGMLDADYIVMFNHEHFGCADEDNPIFKGIPPARPYASWEHKPTVLRNFIEEKGLWNKVLYYDIRDWAWEIDEDMLDKCLAYFKRSSVLWKDDGTPHGTWIKTGNPWYPFDSRNPIHTLGFSILDAYLHPYFKSEDSRPIDVGFYFSWSRLNKYGPVPYSRRIAMYRYLNGLEWSDYTTILGREYDDIDFWDEPIVSPPCPNGWTDYMKLINQTKIIISAQATKYNECIRPYEAISSGALCFLDKNVSPIPNYFKDGKHCFFYDVKDPQSVRNMINLVRYFLQPENEKERLAIAKAGYDHGMKYHKSVHKVDQMLRTVVGK
jgi:hypothetical protein